MRAVRPLVVTSLVGLLVFLFALGGEVASAEPGQLDRPSVVVAPTHVARGDLVTVRLSGWPEGGVTVSVCGQGARNGSQDCDLPGAKGVGIRQGAGATTLRVTPPDPCPCVVHVSTPGSDIVEVSSLEVIGEEIPPPAPPRVALDALPPATNLVVSTTLDDGRAATSPSPDGSADRVLRLELRNTGDVELAGLALTAAVGRDATSGEPVAVPKLDPLGPGATRSYAIPVHISGPTAGTFTVFGRIDGLDAPVSFSTFTQTWPWAVLAVLALVLVATSTLVVRLIVRRPHRRHPTPRPTPLDQISPEVAPTGARALKPQATERAIAGPPETVGHRRTQNEPVAMGAR